MWLAVHVHVFTELYVYMYMQLMEQIEEKECRQSELEARIRSLEQIIIKSKSQPDGTGAGKTGVKVMCGAADMQNASNEWSLLSTSLSLLSLSSLAPSLPFPPPPPQASRRKTICPATLAREMGSPLILSREAPRPRHSFSPVVTPEVVHR